MFVYENEDERPLLLSEYASLTGRSVRSIQRSVREKRIPAWADPIHGKTVTSLAAVKRLSQLASEKAQRECIQRMKLDK